MKMNSNSTIFWLCLIACLLVASVSFRLTKRQVNAGGLSRNETDDYYKHGNRSCQRTYVPFKKGDCKIVKYFEEGTRNLELKNLPNNKYIPVPSQFGNRACIIPNFINTLDFSNQSFSTVVRLYDGVTMEQTHKIKPILGVTCAL